MRFNKYIKISAAVALVITGAASCKKSYLETSPTNQTSPSTVFATVENAEGAVNGLSRMMKAQYLGSQGFNGEGTIKLYYGNYSGNHFSVPLSGWSTVINMDYFSNPTSAYTYFPWYYYYKIIGNANAIIQNIGNAEGSKNKKDFIKAQALTFRAYCYMMLVQLYGDRWSDSNNGATDAVVLRTTESLSDLPLSSLAEAYALIYSDLDEAISLYTSSGLNRVSSQNYAVNIDVAYATYARAAITKQDYVNAEKYAALAKKNYPLMNAAAYKEGFANPTSEWIWSVYDNDVETVYFYSFGAYMGYNSTASQVRTYPKSISKDLFTSIPASDIRKNLFLDPTLAPENVTFSATTGVASPSATAVNYVKTMYPTLQSNASVYSYMQFKFNVNTNPGVSNLPNFRSSEMVLIEAEAKYFQNKSESEIQGLLNTLTKNTGRDTEYNCTASGTDLLNEIKKYRAIELWGEGYDFFDMKRWGDTIKRKSFANGGNFQTSLAVEILPSNNNKWKLVTPQRETDYNTLID